MPIPGRRDDAWLSGVLLQNKHHQLHHRSYHIEQAVTSRSAMDHISPNWSKTIVTFGRACQRLRDPGGPTRIGGSHRAKKAPP